MDIARIHREIERYDPEQPIARASTPPSSWYLDPELYAFELDAVFRANWLVAARARDLRDPGCFVAGRIGREPYLITRDRRGVLRAFYNVCRHHAAILAPTGAGCAEMLTCPYHGWSYDLDGRLRKAPRMGAVEDFDVGELGLVPLAVAEWSDFVMIHLGRPARSPGEQYARLDCWLDPEDMRRLAYVGSRSYEIACNWKVFVDNYLDGGYHVPHAHHELASQLSMKDYRTELFERYSIQWCPGGGEAGESSIRGHDLGGRIGERAIYAWLYPNFMINRYGPAMDTNLVLPLGPERTLVVFDHYFEETEGESMRAFIERSLESADITQREDVELCESVQRGLASSAYDRGRFAPELEIGEHHFHGLLAHDLRAALRDKCDPRYGDVVTDAG